MHAPEIDLEEKQRELDARREHDRAERGLSPTREALAGLKRSMEARQARVEPERQQAYIERALRTCAERSRSPEMAAKALRRAGVDQRLLPPHCRLREQSVPDALRAWARRFPGALAEGGGAYLYGPTGTMKSGAAAWSMMQAYLAGRAVWNERMERAEWFAPTMQWIRAQQLYDAVFRKDRTCLGELRSVGFLVIDEFGRQYEHEWPRAEMIDIIHARFSSCRCTIVTSNTSADSLEAEYETLASRLDDVSGPGIIAMGGRDVRRIRAEREPWEPS